MTKEELRKRMLELDSKMENEDSKAALIKMYEESDELYDKLQDVLYDELEGISAKLVIERIVDRDYIDFDLLISEYLENGDLEKSFVNIAKECGIDINSKRTIIKE